MECTLLNEDFARRNSNQSNTPLDFSGLAANSRIQFYLATRDPSGNATNGITRTSTTRSAFTSNGNEAKSTSAGGHDPWDANAYLNIWVANDLRNQNNLPLLGYAQFPSQLVSNSSTDGVVIWRKGLGRGAFDLEPQYNLGRTATHEIGHWLGLIHIWGDDEDNNAATPPSCAGTDNIYDTPNQGDPTVGQASFPRTDVCSPNYPGIMFMNYMDYTDDNQMNLFTQGQRSVMRSVFDPGQFRQNASYATGRPIIGNEPVCSNTTFSIPNLPTGLNITGWSSDNSNALTIANNGLATRQNTFNGRVNITATVNYGCGTLQLTKSVEVGAGSIGGTYSYGGTTYGVNGSSGISVSNTSKTISFNLSTLWGSQASYSWNVSSTGSVTHGLFNSPSGNITLGGGAQATATCTVTTPCGTLSITYNCYNYSGGLRMVAYPNPANQEMIIAAVKGSEQDSDHFQDKNMAADKPVEDKDLVDISADVTLLDKNNSVMREGKLTRGKLKFSVVTFPNGVYYLQMNFENKQIRKQIIINH